MSFDIGIGAYRRLQFQVVFLARVVFLVFGAGVLRVVDDEVPDALLLVELADLLDVGLDF